MSVNPNKCIGARITPGRKDRTWSPHLFIPKQCRNEPMEGDQLCSTCAHRKQWRWSGGPEVWKWHGTVTEPDIVPPNSHIYGSAWFHEKCKKVSPPPVVNPSVLAERLEAIEKRLTAVEKKLGQ